MKNCFTLAQRATQRICAMTEQSEFTHGNNTTLLPTAHPRHVNMQHSKHKFAFTLAEVLITLGIIGVVAAITLPTLINNYHKKQTATQLRKVYSLIEQAVKRSESDHESLQYWDFSLNSTDFCNRYIKPYFKTIGNYPYGQTPSDYNVYGMNGQLRNIFFDYKVEPKIVLNDGTIITVHKSLATGNKPIISFIADLNGFAKPNKFGRDLFAFSVQQDSGVVPYGVKSTSHSSLQYGFDREYFLGENDYRNCNKNQGGAFCAAVIMIDGWEIADDYPW